MISSRRHLFRRTNGLRAVFAVLAAIYPAAFLLLSASPALCQSSSAAGWRSVSLAEYTQHLQQLDALVASCQTQRASKSDAPAATNRACDPAQVGPDNLVSLSAVKDAKSREIRYDWLRTILARAGNRNSSTVASLAQPLNGAKTKNTSPSIDQLLAEAHTRLQTDEAQANGTTSAAVPYTSERQTLHSILSQRAYQGIARMSARERLLEWLSNWLDKLLASLIRFGSRSPWVVWTLRIFLVLAIAAALAWILFRIDRRSCAKIVPDLVPASGAPSAREWQLWLKDAQQMAAQGRWREAIHFVYWASISRLESRRLWPADRARTPREYLILMPGTDPRKASLAALTRSFERTWYGGRDAASADFQAALDLAILLGVPAE